MPNPSINLMSVLLLIGSAQGLFLAGALLRMREGNRPANRWLAGLLFLFSITLIDGFMEETHYFFRFPHWIGLEWPASFAYGPLIYFYVRSLTQTGPPLSGWKRAAHFIPMLALYIYLAPFFFLTAEQKRALWWAELNDSDTANPLCHIDPVIILSVVQMAVYLALSLRLLAKHSARIKENFSAVEAINLAWLRKVLVVFCLLAMMYAFVFIFSGLFGVYQWAQYLLHLLVALTIYGMGFKGLAQPEIFSGMRSTGQARGIITPLTVDEKTDSHQAAPDHDSHRQAGKYKKSSLTDGQAGIIRKQLLDLMEKEKPYLQMGLTLNELSSMMAVSPHHLSQVINEKLNQSFFDFVNGYRVGEAKRLLVSPQSSHLTILGIAMDAGFSSKSSFYTAFKKTAGVTPSAFKTQSLSSGNGGA